MYVDVIFQNLIQTLTLYYLFHTIVQKNVLFVLLSRAIWIIKDELVRELLVSENVSSGIYREEENGNVATDLPIGVDRKSGSKARFNRVRSRTNLCHVGPT